MGWRTAAVPGTSRGSHGSVHAVDRFLIANR